VTEEQLIGLLEQVSEVTAPKTSKITFGRQRNIMDDDDW
jgi:hypothetical protein